MTASDASRTDSASKGATPQILTRPTLTYRFVRNAMRVWFWTYFRRRIEGRGNVPRTGGLLIVANHQSYLDIPLISIAVSRHVSFVARRSLARSSFLAFIMRECGAVLVDPGKADRAALREIGAHLAAGDCVAIFPEGTRSPDGAMHDFRAGALLAARQAGVPIVPAAIRGTFDAWGKGRSLPRPTRVAIRFGPAIDPHEGDALERVRATIADMIGGGRFDSVPLAP